MLKTLDLSNKGIISLLSRAFSNLSSLTELNLSSNGLENIKNDTFYNLPSLINLDLSSNRITKIGSMFSYSRNPNLVVNLNGNQVNILSEDSFKPFVETVTKNNGNGYITMSHNPLECACDVKWMANFDLGWTSIIRESSCYDGVKLEEVCILS